MMFNKIKPAKCARICGYITLAFAVISVVAWVFYGLELLKQKCRASKEDDDVLAEKG